MDYFFIVLPSSRTSARYHPLPKLRISRSSNAFPFHPGATGARKSLPGLHSLQRRSWRRKSFRVDGRAAAVPAASRWGCGLSGLGGGGSRTEVAAAGTPAAEPAAGEGKRAARAACARARLKHEPDLTARRRQKPPPPLPLP